jgi:predicted type IV restriction endonuclease
MPLYTIYKYSLILKFRLSTKITLRIIHICQSIAQKKKSELETEDWLIIHELQRSYYIDIICHRTKYKTIVSLFP